MSHKRVVIKRGKTYGPYLYESYRDENGKVKKRYLGKVKEKKKFPFFQIFFIIALIALLIVSNFNLTGKASLFIDDLHNSNGTLQGKILFVLQQSEILPADTQVIIDNGEIKNLYILSNLINDSQIQQDYYIRGKEISGAGLGYGIAENRFPNVSCPGK